MKTYTIKEGRHYCEPTLFGLPLHFAFSDSDITFRFRLNANCLYDESKIIPGWNKLYGFSSIGIHSNSVRLSWIVIGGRLVVGYYAYIDGRRFDGDLMIIQPNTWYTGFCKADGLNYIMGVDGVSKALPGGKKPIIAYRAFPYFGGNSTSPQTITIDIEKLN